MSGTGGFQTQVFNQPAAAVAGDFASQNPYSTFDAGPGGLVAGPNGVTVGKFAWVAPPLDPNGTAQLANNSGVGNVAGIVMNNLQGLNTTFLSNAGMAIPKGFPVTLQNGGDYWVVNGGSTLAQAGMKAYAKFTDGSVAFAATASPPTGGVFTGSVAASTFSVTGSIAGNILTVSAVGSGTVVPGATISGTGIASGTKIVSQLTPLLTSPAETLGGVGRYYVSIDEQTVASTTVSGTYGTLTVTGATSGAIAVGDTVSGTNVVAGTTVTAFGTGTGTGASGTYIVDNNTVVSSTTLTFAGYVETKWFAASTGLANEIVKISAVPGLTSFG